MEKRVEKAIDIFLDAINNGTLAKGTCTACAVGNLVSDGMSGKINYNELVNEFSCNKDNNRWGDAVILMDTTYHAKNKESRDCVDATDFTLKELSIIERAFEDNTYIGWMSYTDYPLKEIRADQIKGLEAVIKVMLSFTNDESDVKEVFTKKAELISL